MAHKFKNGDTVFHKGGEGYTTVSGIYTVRKVNEDGTIYRVVDSNEEYTDADEEELVHALYAVFTHVDHGTPIIVPAYDRPLYDHFLQSKQYKFVCESTAIDCIEQQANILKQLNEQ